jgi:adenine-specific DNA methylase
MSDTNDLRLIEDCLPIVAISAQGSREKRFSNTHISMLHLSWALQPVVNLSLRKKGSGQ